MLASEREGDDGGYVNDRWWVHLATRKKITAENQKSPGKLSCSDVGLMTELMGTRKTPAKRGNLE